MTDEILEKMEDRKKAKNTPEYERLNKEIKKMCKQEKEKWCNKMCDEIEAKQNLNGTKKFHDNIKEFVGKKTSNSAGGCIKSKDGEMIFEREKVLNRWSEYIGDLFSDERPPYLNPAMTEAPPF